jgi:hypothetical protein
MRNTTKALFATAALLAAVTTTSVLLAQERSDRHGGMMSMMMNMMGGSMMDQCNQMMGTGSKPNDQWRKDGPAPGGQGLEGK